MRAFGKCFIEEMKFVFLNFLSNEDLSISYESWDIQLTFDTLINTFVYKALSLGDAKAKSACGTKVAEFRKKNLPPPRIFYG